MTTSNEAVLCTSLTILFSDTEDRLVLLASNVEGAKEAFFLTRRLTAGLINGVAALLERSNMAASTAPDEMRNDIVLMEHQGALAGVGGDKQADKDGASKRQSLQVSPRLVANVNIATLPTSFRIVLQSAGGTPVAMVLNRLDLHRVLELLKRKAEGAGWNLQIEADWLGDDHDQITLN